MINYDVEAAPIDLDIDRRCRTVQEELDLACALKFHEVSCHAFGAAEVSN